MQIQQVPELVLIGSDLADAPYHREPALELEAPSRCETSTLASVRSRESQDGWANPGSAAFPGRPFSWVIGPVFLSGDRSVQKISRVKLPPGSVVDTRRIRPVVGSPDFGRLQQAGLQHDRAQSCGRSHDRECNCASSASILSSNSMRRSQIERRPFDRLQFPGRDQVCVDRSNP